MSVTLTINANRSAMVDSSNPTTNYSSSGQVDLDKGAYYAMKALLVGFPLTQLNDYKYRQILGVKYRAYFINSAGAYAWRMGFAAIVNGSWVENAVTWETRPDAARTASYQTDQFYSAGYKDLNPETYSILDSLEIGRAHV